MACSLPEPISKSPVLTFLYLGAEPIGHVTTRPRAAQLRRRLATQLRANMLAPGIVPRSSALAALLSQQQGAGVGEEESIVPMDLSSGGLAALSSFLRCRTGSPMPVQSAPEITPSSPLLLSTCTSLDDCKGMSGGLLVPSFQQRPRIWARLVNSAAKKWKFKPSSSLLLAQPSREGWEVQANLITTSNFPKSEECALAADL